MQFLVEAGLVQRVEGRVPTISLRGADLREAYLFGATLTDANLRNANLSEANLIKANLSEADLRNASLTDADLSDAFLGEARGVTNEELEQQAETLEGAIMPDGSKHS
jgi:uncharacterized protein YjbI with pentapeptide repeats